MAGIREEQEKAVHREHCLNKLGSSIRSLVTEGIPRSVVIEVLAELSIELYEPFA